MSCPTCSHTMQNVIAGVFWCPRCGTLKQPVTSNVLEIHAFDSHVQPKLVERCRDFGGSLGPSWLALWHKIGIRESIWPEEARKETP